MKHSAPYGFGYSHVPHKEGVRILTGSRLYYDFLQKNFIPPKCKEITQGLSDNTDILALVVTKGLASCLNMSEAKLAEKADLPAAYTPHFGMLDIAHYFNKTKPPQPQPLTGDSVAEVNCVPHFDPGLLSISFLSTNEGLQLQDPATGKWIDGPVNTKEAEKDIGVIWLGEAAVTASNGKWKAGIHRVVYPENGKPRLTMWYEMCNIKQASEPDPRYVTPGDVHVPSFLPGSQPIQAKKGEKVEDILRKIERIKGVPMSKVMRFDDSFRALPDGFDF